MKKKAVIAIIFLISFISAIYAVVPRRVNIVNYVSYKIKGRSQEADWGLINLNKPVLISHRGANRIAPENSIPAVDAAGKLGYWGIELDLSSSSDGVLYLMHDKTLDRTTNGKGLITEKTSAQIDRLRIDSGSDISSYHDLRIPHLQDALTECSRYNLVPIFEIKSLSSKERDIGTLVRIIKGYGFEKKVIIHSCNYAALKYLRSRDSRISIMPIINPKDMIHGYGFARSLSSAGLDCNYRFLDKAMVEKAHRDGLKVFCWVIDRKSAFNKAKDMGVDFIYTDSIYPDIYYKTEKEHINQE